MESNYKIAYFMEWSKVKKKNPDEIANRLDVKYSSEKRQFTVEFLYEEYILDCCTETIYKKKDKSFLSISESIIILNYLNFSDEYVNLQNKLVSLKEIPNGGSLFYPAFYKSAIVSLINKYGYSTESLLKKVQSLKVEYASFGDISIIFRVLPKINVCIIVWEGDDEIQPNATLLFDLSIQHLLHIETIIGLGEYLVRRII